MNQLPEHILRTIEDLTKNIRLQGHYAALSERYRTGQDKTLQGSEEHLAYLVSRMPATYAACCEVFGRLVDVPTTLLDVGSGPGTAVLALRQYNSHLQKIVMVERDQEFISIAKKFISENYSWVEVIPEEGTFDLVTSSYMLSELDDECLIQMCKAMIARCGKTIALIDTGTPKGYKAMMQARGLLLEHGFHLVAPCPHAKACPLPDPDWCHFSVRLPRTRQHMQVKGAELGYEDEKFCYLIAAKTKLVDTARDRILASPLKRSGHVHLKLCTKEGTLCQAIVSKKMKERYLLAKKAEWGDNL